MDREALVAARQAVIDRHGPWVWHNVALPYGLFTIEAEPRGDNYRVGKFLQIARDLLSKPFSELRVLDLGCGEGLYALEFAQHGAEAIGIEGREAHLAKAEFARQALDLPNVRFVQGDVREVTAERYGRFDLVLCSGLLYHLDAPSAVALLAEMRRMCSGVCVIDTRIALTQDVSVEHGGRTYWGSLYTEHAPGASEAAKRDQLGASLDNDQSFWFTRQSLANLLADLGYASVFENLMPVPLMLREDRATFVAVPGAPVRPYHAVGRALEGRRWPQGPTQA